MTETRQGEVERGFSMTLCRMFDPRDTGLLLAVCIEAHKPVAFNQYIPATHVHGYSLDVMRRTADPDAPNGLTDFVIIETINWMAETGLHGLGLNFAIMRDVVAGEARGRAVALDGEVATASLQRHNADRVALALQQEVRPGVAPALLGHRHRAHMPGPDWPSPGPSRSPNSRLSVGS